MTTNNNPYDRQTDQWLSQFKVKFSATHKGEKAAPWQGDWDTTDQHWQVRLQHGRHSLTFDFWQSRQATDIGEPVKPYVVLSCLGSDLSLADMTIDEVVRAFGMPPSRAIKAVKFGQRLQRFFKHLPEGAIEALQEIQ